MMRRFLLLIMALSSIALGQLVPVTCVAGARFQVNDLAKAREFYTKIFGFQEKSGERVGLVAFQMNGNQYLEFSSGESGDAQNPLEAIFFCASGKTSPGLKDPDGRQMAFVHASAGGGSFTSNGRSV